MDNNEVLIVVYKEIVKGDLDKFTATSNISPTGGGARDLRFSPSDEFLPIFQRMFPTKQNGMNVGKFHWVDSTKTDVTIASPTKARKNEMRICTVNQCFPERFYPTSAADCILILILDANHEVHPYFTSRVSLKSGAWNPNVSKRILEGLAANRRANQAAMGYLDFENDIYYTNGTL